MLLNPLIIILALVKLCEIHNTHVFEEYPRGFHNPRIYKWIMWSAKIADLTCNRWDCLSEQVSDTKYEDELTW